MKYVTGTRAECDEYEALCSKALGLPVRGVHVGGGRHVTIPASPPGPGWTTAWAEPRANPKDAKLFAVPVCAATKDSAALNVAEKLLATTHEVLAVELDESWDEKLEAEVAPVIR